MPRCARAAARPRRGGRVSGGSPSAAITRATGRRLRPCSTRAEPVDVLFLAESLLPARGGAERFALELLGALAARGHVVRATWLAGAAGPGSAIHELPAGVEGLERPAVPRDRASYWRDTRARCRA